jgi:YjbE family integral membrane protein
MIEMVDLTTWSTAFSGLWEDMQHSNFWIGVLQIIWIDILLAGDNAVVIALACRNLPPHLRYWGMILGAGVAILMRIVFTLVISTLMTMPFLKVAGGLALFYIAIKLLVPEEETHGEDSIQASDRLWGAVKVVAIADVVMSLDNVIAIAAASDGHAALFIFGLAASIPLIIAGASLVMGLLTKYPVLVWAGGALLGWIAGEVIVTDPAVQGFLLPRYGEGMFHVMEYGAAALGGIIVVLMGLWLRRSREAKAKLETRA